MKKSFQGIAHFICVLLLSSALRAQVVPEQAHYVLRPGDTLQLTYRLTPDLDQTIAVAPDGFVNLNVAGDIHVAGLTVQGAYEAILAKDSAQLNSPELTLVLKEFTARSVVVAGEVRGPGRLEMKEKMTAWSAIMQTGGLADSAKSGQVLVFRKVNDQIAEVLQLNFSKMKKAPDLKHDLALEPGDTVYVPRDRIAVAKHYTSLLNFGASFNPTTIR